MVRMGIYAEHREFKGEQWMTTGKFQFMDAMNPRIFSNNVLVPFMVAALEEYFEATFVALLKYSDNKLSILKNSRIRGEDLFAIAAGKTSVERGVSDQFSFQNLEQIVSHFRAVDKRLDVAGALRKPYRKRKQPLYDSLSALIQHRHDIIHRGQISTEFTDEVAFKALEDLEEAVTRVYRMITSTFKWHFIQDWGSGTKRIRREAARK